MARLTALQKEILDNAVLDYIKENVTEGSAIPNTNALMMNVQTDFPYGKVSIDASMNRLSRNSAKTYVNCIYGTFYYKDKNHIYIDEPTYKVRKEKNLLYFEDLGNDYYYDFITKQFSKDFFDNRVVSNWNNLYRDTKEHFSLLLENEWLFNYCDNLYDIYRLRCSSYIPNELLKTAPKGLVDALKENDNVLSETLLRNLYYFNLFGKYSKFFESFMYDMNTDFSSIMNFIKVYNAENIFKMIKLNLLNGNFNWRDNLKRLIRNYNILKSSGVSTIQLDLNRDLAYNADSLQDLVDAEKNKILESQLQKLNFINGLTKGDLKVVVPQNQREKQDEGRQQNNCVGHYYDNAIMRGDDFIYFIRRADNDKKSYVTCRDHVSYEETTEFRVKNNYSVHDRAVIEFIKEIDQIIKENLKR